ncbi:MAG: ATP-binding cassette domain-containing protein [Propionibacteriaceae bacterium]|jgi:phosphate transport system ATP-binding protein|nr:ATP-binding cassette domain-containing protein [Propionibacteriaceae bacterium]
MTFELALRAPELTGAGHGRDDTANHRLAVVGLTASYGRSPAITEVSLSLESRSVTAFIGPSGCGKSTLLRTFNRLHEVTPGARVTGAVRLDGIDLYDPRVDPVTVRRRIGMVFQRPNPFPTLSIRDNVLAGIRLQYRRLRPSGADELVEAMLTAVGLWDEVKDCLGRPGISLSGGQQQRLCIARVIAVAPDVILMDEPCSSLDPVSTAAIEELMVNLGRDYTVVVVTHNLQQAARVSRKTAFFTVAGAGEPGRLVEYGDTAGLFSAPSKAQTADYLAGRFG